MKRALVAAFLLGTFVWGDRNTSAEPRVANARQIPGIFSVLTGISDLEGDVQTYYEANAAKLPQFGNLSEVSMIFFLTELSYSSLYCNRFVGLESSKLSAQRWAFQSVDFSESLLQFQNQTRATSFFEAMSLQFWGRKLNDEEKTILNEEFAGWIDGDKNNLKPALVGLCSIFLSSPQVWVQ